MREKEEACILSFDIVAVLRRAQPTVAASVGVLLAPAAQLMRFSRANFAVFTSPSVFAQSAIVPMANTGKQGCSYQPSLRVPFLYYRKPSSIFPPICSARISVACFCRAFGPGDYDGAHLRLVHHPLSRPLRIRPQTRCRKGQYLLLDFG